MKKVLIATEKPFAKEAVDGIKNIIEQSGHQCLLLEKYDNKTALLEAVANVNAIIIRSDIVDEEVLNAAKKLEIVVRAGAGYDNVNLEVATKNNVVVMNTPGQNSNAVAELAIGLMLLAARHNFNGKSGGELRGKKLGLHAFGNVSRYLAVIAQGFGMDVYAFDPFVSAEDIARAGVKPVSTVEELYKTCQYVSLHIPANEKTNNSINAALLNLMPKGATLVNTARKEVIDEKALLEMFANRPDFKMVSDIAPKCADEIAQKFAGRFYFTAKKCGAQTEEANVNAGMAAAVQITNFFHSGDKTFQVN